MSLATSWVEPGKGDPVGWLWDHVMRSGAVAFCDSGVREAWGERGRPSDEERRRRTRIVCNAVERVGSYDVERIYAAIWEYDQDEGGR